MGGPRPGCASAPGGARGGPVPGPSSGLWYSIVRDRCERHTARLPPTRGHVKKKGIAGYRSVAAGPLGAGLASLHPLPGPDAKTTAFPTISFSRTRAFAGARREPAAGEGREMDIPDATEGVRYESALTELLAAGITADVRSTVENFRRDPQQLVEAYN